jgi:hypothetical protein
LEEFDPINDMLTIQCGKAGKVEVNSRLKSVLVEFRKISRSEYPFVNDRTGKPILSPKTAFHNAVRRAGIGHCRFHDLSYVPCLVMF